MTVYNAISLAGIFILIGFGYVISENRKSMKWKPVMAGLVLQMLLGFLIFTFPAGTQLFIWVNSVVSKLVDIAGAGGRFLFGPLALGPGTEGSIGFILAFQALPAIVFFSALIAILYYFKIMPFLIRIFAKVFTKLFRTSGAESLVASSNIFVGVESVLTVKPYLTKLTRSEMTTVMTAGMATVASNVLAAYVFMLQADFGMIAGHLVSASILSAPAAIVFAKLLVPETDQPETLGADVHPEYEREGSFIEAVINGSQSGLKLITGIVALLLGVIGLVALVDAILGSLTSLVGLGGADGITLADILAYLFYPFTILTGVPFEDAMKVSGIIGQRLIVTEFVSYQSLAALIAEGSITPRTAIITAYALCGFAHFASLAIFSGGVIAIAPEKTSTVASVSIRALIAANLACLMTACCAGFFFTGQSVLFTGQ